MESGFQHKLRTVVQKTKECAICRRGGADYEHICGVAFHKGCIEQYFNAISGVDGAERICPHCYIPVPLDLEPGKETAVEVSLIPEEIYNQYLELSDEFSLALIDGSIRDISVFLNSPDGEQYFVNIDFEYYPKKPTFSFTDELLVNIDGLDELLENLNNWDPKSPPRLVDVLYNIQSRIKPSEEIKEEDPEREDKQSEVKEIENGKKSSEEKNEEVVEVLPEGEFIEVTPQSSDIDSEEVFEVKEVLPETFFEIEPSYDFEIPDAEATEDSFENEEAISQYLDLSNNFSLELVGDKMYHVVVYLSCLDAGIYNIYPVTINYKEFPKKPSITFTDDLLIRIRGIEEIFKKLKHWEDVFTPNLVDILQGIEVRLVEDSMIESEFEVIKREYRAERLSKNRFLIRISTYGPKFIDIDMDLRGYPSPPVVTLPKELKGLDIEELEGIKKWPKKPQKRIMDVLRNLSQVINNIYRREFEELLLRLVTEDFEVVDGGYKVTIPVPSSTGDILGEAAPKIKRIQLNIKVPQAYPLVPPEILVDIGDLELKESVKAFFTDILKSWAPSMFLVDAINRLSLSLWNTSLFKCLICGQKECPVCGLPLLTQPVVETKDLCEMPCIQCKKPYHVHCLHNSIEEGITECGYCQKDLGNFLKRNLFQIVS
ncbi:MAG: E3 ubiquitin protein ligase [Thermoplasmata archaeon]|nr:MAG: E3 ubiquitin protein ligase [Thermoplasmata archaeon]